MKFSIERAAHGVLALTAAAAAGSAAAQSEMVDLLSAKQEATIGRLVSDLSSSSADRRQFALWSLDTTLAPSGGAGPMIGAELAVGRGLLPALDAIIGGSDSELAGDARRLRDLIGGHLNIADAGNAARLDAPVPNQRIDGVDGDTWYRLDLEPGREYTFESADCTVLNVVALEDDATRGIAGGVGTDGRFAFVPADGGAALIRASFDDCVGEVSLIHREPPVAMAAAPTRRSAVDASPGQRYLGRFSAGDAQWIRVDLSADVRYRFDLSPVGGIDTTLTVFEDDGSTQIAYDDDGGEGLGSRVDLVRQSSGVVYVQAAELGDSAGAFEFEIAEMRPPVELARPVRVGERIATNFSAGGEDWWLLEVRGGRQYEISTDPSDGVDTLLAVFDGSGSTMLAENDDYGVTLGSRVTHGATGNGRILIRVTEYDGAGGEYRLNVDEWDASELDATNVRFGRAHRGAVPAGEAEWWRIEPQGGGRYLIDVAPEDGIDTIITLYDETGANELDSDDDGGDDLGSRLEFTASSDAPLLLRVEELSGAPGAYTLRVDARERPADVALPIAPGRSVDAVLTYGGENWWRFDGEAGTTYVLEADPRGSVDTVMTLFEGENLVEVAENDDGGSDLGSRIEYTPQQNETFFVLIRDFDSDPGEYTMSLRVR